MAAECGVGEVTLQAALNLPDATAANLQHLGNIQNALGSLPNQQDAHSVNVALMQMVTVTNANLSHLKAQNEDLSARLESLQASQVAEAAKHAAKILPTAAKAVPPSPPPTYPPQVPTIAIDTPRFAFPDNGHDEEDLGVSISLDNDDDELQPANSCKSDRKTGCLTASEAHLSSTADRAKARRLQATPALSSSSHFAALADDGDDKAAGDDDI